MSLINIAKSISDHGNEAAAKFIHYIGVVSVGGGVTTGVVNDTYTSKILSPELWTISDFAAIVGAIGGVTLIVQNIVNIWFAVQEKRLKIKRMQKTQDEKLTELGDKIIEELARRQEENK